MNDILIYFLAFADLTLQHNLPSRFSVLHTYFFFWLYTPIDVKQQLWTVTST